MTFLSRGAVAQLGARVNGIHEVMGSIPISSTNSSQQLSEPAAPPEADFDPEEDAIVFRRLARNANWVAVIEECPVPMDDLPPRRRKSFRSKL